MALTLIRHSFWSPDRIARSPVRCRGGWLFTHPPKNLWRYNHVARSEAIQEWAAFGASALTSLIGGVMIGPPPLAGMALASFGQTVIPFFGIATTIPSFATQTINAAGNYYALVFQAPKTGSLRTMAAQIAVATGSPTAAFQFETVDATTGLPTGTLFGTNTAITGVAISTGWLSSGNMVADASVIGGTSLLAAVIRYSTGTSIGIRANTSGRNFFPYFVLNGAKTPAVLPTLAIGYSDGSYAYIPGTEPFTAINPTSFSSASNPNHRGGAWTAPGPMRAVGGWLTTNLAGNCDCIIASDSWDGTADNDGTSNLDVAVDKDQIGAGAPAFFLSSTTLTLSTGVIYRSLCKPGASTLQVYDGQVNAAAILDQMELGQGFQLTTANNPSGSGSWSPVATKRPYCGFWIDQFDDGVQTLTGTRSLGTLRMGHL